MSWIDLDEYDRFTEFTAKYGDRAKTDVERLIYATLGLSGEAGELANKVKKIIRDDDGRLTLEKRLQLIDELGDVLWYASRIAQELGHSTAFVAMRNKEKLESRKTRGVLSGSGDSR